MNKIAIVTGGNKGIGKAISDKLRDSYEVVTCSRNEEDTPNHYVCDITNEVQVQRFADNVKRKYGYIDVLINNAGGCAKKDYPFREIPFCEWQEIINLNLNSVALVTQTFYDLIREGGSIINISSTLTRTPMKGKSLYSTSKAGMEVLTRNLALELADRKIRVNCVSHGPTDTELLRNNFVKNGKFDKQSYKQFSESLPLGRIVEPEDVADLVYFLSSDNAKIITGQIISVDGGRSLKW